MWLDRLHSTPHLRRMVVHHIDVNLDPLVVEGLHQGLELAGWQISEALHFIGLWRSEHGHLFFTAIWHSARADSLAAERQ
jgi:hypothetical protein